MNQGVAVPVERSLRGAAPQFLGKDEVASSNLASSSKDTPKLRLRSFLFVSAGTGGLMPCPKGRLNSEVVRLRGGNAGLDRVASSNLASGSEDTPKFLLRSFFIYKFSLHS